MHKTTRVALLSFALHAPLLAQGREPVPNPPPSTAPQPVTDPSARVLGAVELKGVTLRDAMERLREIAGVDVFVSWNVMERAGVSANTPVDAKLTGVTLGKVLDLVLADAGGGTLAWVVDEGVVRVSTQADLERVAVSRRERRDWDDGVRVQAALDKRLPPMTFDRTPLWQAIEQVSQAAGLKTFVHWRVLDKDANVGQSQPITLQLKETSAGAALREILDGVDEPRKPLAYAVRGGGVEVTTREALRNSTEVRVYDLRDLLTEPLPANTATTRLSAERVPDRVDDRVPHTAPAAFSGMEDYRRLIEDMVDADSWRDKGGSIGAINVPGGPFRGLLVVTQTNDNHDRIRELLTVLRSYRAGGAGPAGAPVPSNALPSGRPSE